jgi:hypothetical protein
LTEVKEAKDVLDMALISGNACQQQESLGMSRKHPRSSTHWEELEDLFNDAVGYSHLEPTPLAIQNAAYADDSDADIDDIGIRLGRMRLGERLGGMYRPRIADEVWKDD